MSIWSMGSINMDHVYRMPRLPAAGETVAATDYACGLGGKGANQSIAASFAGANVFHIGAVGTDGDVARAGLTEAGVDVSHVPTLDAPTGHAIINVDDAGENAIVVLGGANLCQAPDAIRTALDRAARGDILMLQNETNAQVEAATLARDRGLMVAYSAAPFDPEAVRRILPLTDLLLVNEGEAAQISTMMKLPPERIPVARLLVTKGADGATLYRQGSAPVEQAAFKVTVKDTTGAGDTFAGFFLAGLDQGMSEPQALERAAAASALQVTRHGAAKAIPEVSEVMDLLRQAGK